MRWQATKPGAWVWMGMAVGIVIAGAWAPTAAAQNAVNPDAALMQDFANRVADYMKLHKTAEATLPSLKRSTESQEKIQHHQHQLRRAIVARRAGAVQGNVFTPAISAEFRHLIGIAYQADAKQIRQSLLRGEPGTRVLHIRVNREYPDKAPLQTMPTSLLQNLPSLPPELEYRVVGGDLILRDNGANLIVDVVPSVIPQ